MIYTFPESSHLPRAAAHRATGRRITLHGCSLSHSSKDPPFLQKHPKTLDEPKTLWKGNSGRWVLRCVKFWPRCPSEKLRILPEAHTHLRSLLFHFLSTINSWLTLGCFSVLSQPSSPAQPRARKAICPGYRLTRHPLAFSEKAPPYKCHSRVSQHWHY